MPALAPQGRRFYHEIRLFALLAVLVVVCGPVTADWLSLHDGNEIETDGAWRNADGLVTFKMAKRAGYFSVPADSVDFDRSQDLTLRREAADRAPAQTPVVAPKKRAAVLVIKDGDVRKVRRDSPPAAEDARRPAPPTGEEALASPRRLGEGLEVVTWRLFESDATGGVVVEGELRNKGRGLAIGLELSVSLTGGDGTVVATRSALLSATTLAPAQRSRFRVEFQQRHDFEDVEFEMENPAVAYIRILGASGPDLPGDVETAAS